MAWTKMQEKAIYTRGDNILVSAGAGSGKTAVLSERILDYCLQGNDIRKVLVLTFTNAAAAEMKERIRKKLIDNNLLEQASLIDSADITTFDAYSLGLVKKYYYKLNLDKDISIIDGALLSVKKTQIIDELFDKMYLLKDEKFFNLLRKYAKQNDDNVKKIVESLLNKLELLVDEEEYVKNYEKTYYSDAAVNRIITDYSKLVLKEFNQVKIELDKLYGFASCDEASEKLATSIEELLSVCESIETIDDLFLNKDRFTTGRKSPKASELVKAQKDICDELIKSLKTKYLCKYNFISDAKNEILSIKDDILFLLDLAMKVEQRLFDYKLNIMSFGYGDIAKMAIKLVTEFDDVHNEISNNLNEILIDEYQDTSDIQETFIQAVSRNNCYMVGDIKQSIYRFRNANPYIFKSKYDKYTEECGGLKIDLTNNFRSRKEVLDDINMIFSSLMTSECGDANYSIDHIMHYGQKDYELLNQDFNFNMDILGYDSVDGFDDAEVEAFICGSEIKKLIDSNTKCLKKGKYENVSYNDIAILIDKTKNFITFKKVFEYLGIPLSIEADLDLKDSILPKLFANILCLISCDNKSDKAYLHSLASIGRSFLFEYKDTEIYQLLNNGIRNELIEIVERISAEVDIIPLMDLFFVIIDEFKIYEKLPLIGEVENSCVVLDYIYNMFKTMTQAKMSVSEASQYLNDIFDNGIDLKYKVPSASHNSVHIMTIHKSKGLEYPYCYFPMLGSKFNDSDIKESFGLASKYGVYIPFSDEGNSDTIIKALEANEARKADISEKVRLLYVACTRAREKMIFISNNQEYKDSSLKPTGFKCFNHMLRSLKFLEEQRINVDPSLVGITKDYNIVKSISKISGQELISYDNAKYVSDVLAKKNISKELKELTDSSLNSALELGIKFHACLEALDFKNIDVEGLPVDDFMKNTLAQLLKHPVFANIKNAKTFHEHEFYYNEYHGIIDLFCVYDDHIDIIDYKLSNVDSEEYIRQLNIYKEYISSKSDLKVNCYLLSILRKEIKQVA